MILNPRLNGENTLVGKKKSGTKLVNENILLFLDLCKLFCLLFKVTLIELLKLANINYITLVEGKYDTHTS